MLVPGSTLLEVHGSLGRKGEVTATRIEIEDQSGGSGSQDQVRIEGIVFSIAADRFVLQIRAIEEGAAVAEPVLEPLRGLPFIDVSFDGSTVFLREEGGLTNSGALAVGQEVDVEFCSFAAQPFPACQVAIEDQDAEFEGVVAGLAGVPAAFEMHLEQDEPAIAAGLVQDATTDVRVDLSAGTLLLNTPGEPVLDPEDLRIGLEVEARGRLSGPPTGPMIAATRTRVIAGFLRDAFQAGLDPTNSRFVTTGGELVDPFGKDVDPGPQMVAIEPACVFEGAAASETEFFELLGGPQGAQARIDVRGIGTGGVNEIRAFAIEVELPQSP